MAADLYNLHATAESLPSERDQNFLLTDTSSEKVVLKIANTLEDEAMLQAQSAAMMHVSERLSFCQRLIPSVNGNILERVTAPNGETNLVRVATYLSGVALGETREHSALLLRDLGNKLARLETSLSDFDHSAIHRDFHWDLANWRSVITEYSDLIIDRCLRTMVLNYASVFEKNVDPLLSALPRSVIHGDTNDYNILINDDCSEVVGIIDFGDMVYSYTTADLAIALAYVVLNNESKLVAAANVVAGYKQVRPLSDGELAAIWGLIIMRLCMSVCIAAYQQQHRPDNEYLDISQQAICATLPKLMAIEPVEAMTAFQQAT